MRVDQQGQAAERCHGANHSFPPQALDAGDRRCQSGQDWIGEIGQNRRRHIDRLNGLEQTEYQSGENDTVSETIRTAGVAVGLSPNRNQVATNRSPTMLRKSSIETTSTPPVSTILPKTSEMPSDIPAATPGPRRCTRSPNGEELIPCQISQGRISGETMCRRQAR